MILRDAGTDLIVDHIEHLMIDACGWRDQLRLAADHGDIGTLQHAAAALHEATQSIQVLAHSLARAAAKHRSRGDRT